MTPSYRSNWGRTRPEPDMDPGDCTDHQLEIDMPKQCPSCGVTRKNLCDHDAAFHTTPFAERPLRPRGCLATAQLAADQPLPYT